jgi:hypothetical protein
VRDRLADVTASIQLERQKEQPSAERLEALERKEQTLLETQLELLRSRPGE